MASRRPSSENSEHEAQTMAGAPEHAHGLAHQHHHIFFASTHRRSSSSSTTTTTTADSAKTGPADAATDQSSSPLLSSVPAKEEEPYLYILLPVLMNLKGNLEMNLAARLSTSANVGDLDSPKKRRALVVGNLTLLQVQALIVSFAASLLSFVLGVLSRNNLPTLRIAPAKPLTAAVPAAMPAWNSPLQGGYAECLLVLAAGMLAASVNSLLLGGLVSGLVIACRVLRINPDNITTPIASSLGDLMTLVFLSLASSLFIRFSDTWTSTVIFALLACSVGLHGYLTVRNGYVRGFLGVGWTPLFVAMAISTCSGLVLEKVVVSLPGFAAVAPVLTGICGNIGTISVSRISTALHASAASRQQAAHNTGQDGFLKLPNHDYDDLDDDEGDDWEIDGPEIDILEPPPSSSTQEPACKVALVLLLLSTAILAGFALINMGRAGFDLGFFVGFMLCVLWTSAVSLLAAYHLTHLLWTRNLDPDIYAIPLLSSSIDLIGQASLVLTFLLFKS
ncbi:hypothetical protein PtB15_7B346 [Puccinia triticina]|nr:hypothetical protein PtB15_7B346 [Puccinia triticina]